MAVCKGCPGCPGGSGIYPLQACCKQAHARLAKPAPSSALPRSLQGLVRAGGRATVAVVAQSVEGNTLAFTFAASQVTVLPRLATTALTAVHDGWRISENPRAHVPVLRANAKQHRAFELETSDPGPPALQSAVALQGGRQPQTHAGDKARGRPQPPRFPQSLGDRDARASSPLPERRSSLPWSSAARSGPGVAAAHRPGCSVLSASGEKRSRVARTDRTRAAIRLPGAQRRGGAE